MLTIQFYHYPNTDFYWQITATSVVLWRGVDSIKFYSSGPRLEIWVGVSLQDCKTFVQSHVLAQPPPGRRPAEKSPVNTSHRSRFVQKIIHSQHRLEVMIIIFNLPSDIYIYIDTLFLWSGKKKLGTAVNAACQENLLACHRFASPGLAWCSINMRDFRFSRRRVWRWQPSRTLRRVVS
jgi:hypothetical protein